MRNSDDSRMSFEEGQNKDKYSGDLQRVYQALFDTPQTMKEVDVSIGVMRNPFVGIVAHYAKRIKSSKSEREHVTLLIIPKHGS